jgi:hypothetical protein
MSDTWNPSGNTLIQTDDGERSTDRDDGEEYRRLQDLTSKLVKAPKFVVDDKGKGS